MNLSTPVKGLRKKLSHYFYLCKIKIEVKRVNELYIIRILLGINSYKIVFF